MAKNIDPELKLISSYLKINEKESFVIPEYQREYSWNINQCDKLWQDIEAFIDSGATDPYFFGTIIVDCSTDNEFNLIDGQQRTTTFLLLLKALLLRLENTLKVFKISDDSEALNDGLKENKNKIIDILYKADVKKRALIKKDWNIVKNEVLLQNKSINEPFKNELKSILYAETYDEAEATSYKIPRKQKDNKYTNFFKNFKFFYEKLGEYSESRLNNFADVFLGECQIIEIRSWQIEQAITMFNSLNSTGLPLSDADIISAQLYSHAGDDKENFNLLWEKINKLASELNSRKIISIDGVLQEYMYMNRAKSKEYMRGENPDVTVPGLRNFYINLKKDLLTDPMALCGDFKKIVDIWDKVKEYPIVKLLLKFNENAKLYLISYLMRSDVAELSEDKILDITEALIRLFALLELVDAGYSSTKFKTFLFRENIKLVDANVPAAEIVNDFNAHINANWNETEITSLISDYDGNILIFLNDYLYAKKKGEAFDFAENVNIEHIMPGSGRNIDAIRQDAKISTTDDFKSYVNKLGNKILLEEDINKSIGNDWFRTKKKSSVKDKKGYKNSQFALASTLAGYSKDIWTYVDIDLATEKATKRIIKFLFNK